MYAQWKVINMCLFTTEIIYPDLWIRDTTAVSAFGIWLVFAVTITASRTTTHGINVELRGMPLNVLDTSFIVLALLTNAA